jgi:universal stress protein E
MKTRQSVMVALGDLSSSHTALLRKAARIAKSRRAELRLVHVIPLPYGPVMAAAADIKRAARAQIDDCTQRLRKLSDIAELRGLRRQITVTWDYPVADALVRQVLRHRPQLLLVQSHRHSRLARVWLDNTDWELIRKCPIPVWFSKTSGRLAHGRVFAAIDPLHAHAKPAAVDKSILHHAVAAAAGRAGRVTVAHIYSVPATATTNPAVEPYWLPPSAEEQRVMKANARRAVAREIKPHGIEMDDCLVVQGDASDAIPRLVKKSGARLLVMGAVSRSGIRGLFIGHTAERVIDSVDCDVLVVKPRGFRTSVERRVSPRLTPPPMF